jgi:uncharacterized membrane protein YbaN (DUF454 family)
VALGFIGAALPIVPTTPFMILAAWCFTRSSEKMHQWVLNTPLCGRFVRDWEEHGVIRTRAKQAATVMIAIPMVPSGYIYWHKPLVPLCLALCAAGVLGFIWTRPSSASPKGERQDDAR